MMLAVTTYRYRSSRSDEPLRTKLVELALQKPRYGYGRLQAGGTEWEASKPQATAADLNEADR